jgi:hypothetical protein
MEDFLKTSTKKNIALKGTVRSPTGMVSGHLAVIVK